MKIKKSIFILMVIVLITILGTVLYKGEKYNLIIIASFALSCLPFYFKYENSKPKKTWLWLAGYEESTIDNILDVIKQKRR